MSENYFNCCATFESKINEEYNVTQKEVLEMVQIVLNWLKIQKHLPLESDEILEEKIKFMLRANKMSVEKTKQKLDNYYSSRNIFTEHYTDREPECPNIQLSMNTLLFMPLKTNVGLTRIVFFKLLDIDPDKYNAIDVIRCFLNYQELRIRHDLLIKETIIGDMSGFTLSHLMQWTPVFVMKAVKLFEKAFSDRIAQVHYINCPSYAKTFIDVVNTVTKGRLTTKFFVHDTYEDLSKHIPLDILPKEYGGNDESIMETYSEWKKFVLKNKEYLKETNNSKSDEKLRPDKATLTNVWGIEGSFRKLDID